LRKKPSRASALRKLKLPIVGVGANNQKRGQGKASFVGSIAMAGLSLRVVLAGRVTYQN
jgi:hypothetical protein